MTAVRLEKRQVDRVWGRRDLGPFGSVAESRDPVGEIWFEDVTGDPELLVKYLFTSERLSIQVHPNDAEARARGHKRGKDEAWVVLSAEPGAVIGIGLREELSRDALRAAALDGRIEQLVDWRPAKAGDVYYSPAGTIHAIGPGLTLIEVQQNIDLTYRLYDYGRPRELHLDEGVAVADPCPFIAQSEPVTLDQGRTILFDGPAFVLERWSGAVSGLLHADAQRPVWVIPISGRGRIDGRALEPGTVWFIDDATRLELGVGIDLLLAYPGSGARRDIITKSKAACGPL